MERENFYIIRNGEIEHVWEYQIMDHGFSAYLYCRGTESEVREYIESEYPHEKSKHHALSPEQVELLGCLRIKIFVAPRKEG